VNTGSWTDSPTSFRYQWDRYLTTSAQPPRTRLCSGIGGATGSTYTVQLADVGYALVPIVTAYTGSTPSRPTSLAGRCNTGEMLGATPGTYMSIVPTAQPAGRSPISAVVGTTRAGERFCTNAVATCGYGDPLNQTVGVPAGVTPSTTGACARYTNGATISSGVAINGCKIKGQIYIIGGTVRVENSDLSLADESGAGAPILLRGGSLTARYDTIHGLNPTTSGSMAWAIYDYPGAPAATVGHVFFYNGDRIFMNMASSSTTPTVTNSFCWNNSQVVFNGSQEHYECVYTEPPSNIAVQNDVMLNWHDQTGTNYVDDNIGSCCGSVDAENNLLGGGSYTIYGGGSQVDSETYSQNRFTRVMFRAGGLYGPGAYNATTGFSSSGTSGTPQAGRRIPEP
jgi:hypothetical protein